MNIRSFVSGMKNKVLENSAYQEKFQQAWNTHAAVFGPIMEPAFVNNSEARTHMVAALSQIGKNEPAKALQTLKQLEKHLHTDADRAAHFYLVGLAMERSGKKDESMGAYIRANTFRHDFYLPYMKVARAAHGDMEFDIAEENYLRAIACLEKMEQNPQHRTLLATACANLAGCCTYMHRCEDAEKYLARSHEVLPTQEGRESVTAMLAAVQGQAERAEENIAALDTYNPKLAAATREQTEAILSGKNPHFATKEADTQALIAFWQWFIRNEKTLFNLLSNKNVSLLSEMLQEQLEPIFAPAQLQLAFGVQYDGKVFTINMCDRYSRTARAILSQMLALRPELLPDRWAFRIIHSPAGK